MCCTPYIATIVAGVLGIFQSFANLSWNASIILCLAWNNTRIASMAPVDVTEIENPFGVYGVTIILAILNFQLLVFSCLMLKANVNLRTGWIGAWCIFTLIRLFIDVTLGTYYFYKYESETRYRTQTYFRLAALFSGVFFFWPVINVIFCTLVLKRYIDIGKSTSSDTSLERTTNPETSQPPPYTPGSFALPRHNRTVDPAPVTGWSNQPLLSFDDDPVATANIQ